MRWEWQHWDEIDRERLYRLLVARAEVFVVEQQCIYLDPDRLDRQSWHLSGWSPDGRLGAYLRIIAPGVRFPEHTIGRVLTTAPFRGGGLGRQLMEQALAEIGARFGAVPVRLAAQCQLQRFYESLGFQAVGGEYDEDGIPHIDMLRRPGAG